MEGRNGIGMERNGKGKEETFVVVARPPNDRNGRTAHMLWARGHAATVTTWNQRGAGYDGGANLLSTGMKS